MAGVALLTTGVVIGVLLSLAATKASSEMLALVGSAVGALLAALAAVGAVEYDANRKVRTAKNSIAEILTFAAKKFDRYGQWIDNGALPAGREQAGINLSTMVRAIREAIALSRDLRTSVEYLSRTYMALEYHEPDIAKLELAIANPELLSSFQTREYAGMVATTVMILRDHLLGRTSLK